MKKLVVLIIFLTVVLILAICYRGCHRQNAGNPSAPSDNSSETTNHTTESTELVTDSAETQATSHTHNYTALTVAPTCSTDGYTTYTCACGDTYTDNKVTATGHNYAQETTAPTCTAQGYTTYTCACGETYVGNYISPAHSYTDYVCRLCGAVDKSHAYEYLLANIKQYRNSEGEYGKYSKWENGALCSITYYASDDCLYVTVIDDVSIVSVNLMAVNMQFHFSCFYRDTARECEGFGKIAGKDFAAATSVSFDNYRGNADDRTWFAGLTGEYLHAALLFLDGYMAVYVPEISLADLGFANY